uniref:Uncharacterized protein n=1 Tax=Caenorhabditis japonica TaxID=281687 RepID=A0A8R1E661_CAEJA
MKYDMSQSQSQRKDDGGKNQSVKELLASFERHMDEEDNRFRKPPAVVGGFFDVNNFLVVSRPADEIIRCSGSRRDGFFFLF